MDFWLDYLETQFNSGRTDRRQPDAVFAHLHCLGGFTVRDFTVSISKDNGYQNPVQLAKINRLYLILPACNLYRSYLGAQWCKPDHLPGFVVCRDSHRSERPSCKSGGLGFIIWRHPFRVGDRIQVGDQAGDVIDLRIFQFSLMEIGNWVAADQSTGRIIHVPNGIVFTHPLANYSLGFDYIWNEIPITDHL